MLLVSSHLANYIPHQEDMVYRINMAWRENIDQIIEDVQNMPGDVFLDNPSGRSKPPNNKYTEQEVVDVYDLFPDKVKYIAVSNVESTDDLEYYRQNTDAIIVPKIETSAGVSFGDLFFDERHEKRYVMLDHDDLIADLRRKGRDIEFLYEDFIDPFKKRCAKKNINVLVTAGVVFSDR